MKSFLQNQMLSLAVAVSILLHGTLLAVNFISPKSFSFASDAQKLDIILVNAKHERAPLKPDALAQANLEGGGKTKDARMQAPTPDSYRRSDGASQFTAQSQTSVSRQSQRNLISLLNQKESELTAIRLRRNRKKVLASRQHKSDRTVKEKLALARSAAELSYRIRDSEKPPKKTYISPSTKEVPVAIYYAGMQRRIEKLGELNFPHSNGRKLYGELVIAIPIFHDGTIYEGDGGPVIKKSSGNSVLDAAAKRIVRRAAPFGRFPPDMRAKYTDIWVLTTRFEFTRDNRLESRKQN